jgi:hypothetical protein
MNGNWQCKTEVLLENSALVPLCRPGIELALQGDKLAAVTQAVSFPCPEDAP